MIAALLLQPHTPAPQDPLPDPAVTLEAARTAVASGLYTLAVCGLLFAAARTLYWFAENKPGSTVVRVLRLHRPIMRGVVVGAVSLLGALVAELTLAREASWQVLVGAVATTVTLYLRESPRDKPPVLPAVDVRPFRGNG